MKNKQNDNQNNILFQAEKHPLVSQEQHTSLESYCLELIHRKAYEVVAQMATGLKVLDFGCNDGYGTMIINSLCKEVIGIDVSSRAIETARCTYDQYGVQFHLFDGKRTVFDNEYFDIVVSLQVIEHIEDYNTYLSEIQRVVCVDGIVIFTTPNAAIRIDPGMKPLNPFHTKEFTATELSNLLEKWFPEVVIQGLFATDTLYNVEFDRLKKGRERARRKTFLPPSWEIKTAFINGVKTVLPNSIVNHIRRVFQRVGMGTRFLNGAIMNQYSAADFFYSRNNIDKSLDLMAICYCKANNND